MSPRRLHRSREQGYSSRRWLQDGVDVSRVAWALPKAAMLAKLRRFLKDVGAMIATLLNPLALKQQTDLAMS